MVLTVLENAYLRMAEQHPNFSEAHKKILLQMTHEKRYYTKDEFLYLNSKLDNLEKIFSDLESISLIKTDGWLVKLNDIK